MSLTEFSVAAVVAAMANAQLQEKTVDKLSTGKVGATPERAKIAKAPVDVMLIFGEVVGVEQGEDKRTGQEWSALKGDFYAVKTDEPDTVYSAGLLFLPAGQAKLEAAVMTGELDKKDRPVYGRVEFAVMLVAVPAGNARGYSWELRSLVDAERPTETSAKGRMLAKMAAKAPALPAPAETGDAKPAKK